MQWLRRLIRLIKRFFLGKMEIEFKNYTGFQESVTPDKNGCTKLYTYNVDPRGSRKGSLILSPKIESYLSRPTSDTLTDTTDLGFFNMYVTQFGESKNVTFLIQKGTVNRITGSGASVTTKDTIAVWMYPDYVPGTGWVNAWRWVNKTEITTIDSISGSLNQLQGFTTVGSEFGVVFCATVYNVTKSEYATVLDVDGFGVFQISRTVKESGNWAIGDTVIFVNDFVPFDRLEANADASFNDVSFHSVANDIRVGFGGFLNRLGIGVGHRYKFFNIHAITGTSSSTLLNNARNIDRFLVNAFNNSVAEDTFNLSASLLDSSYGNTPFPSDARTLYLKVTAVLDNYQEFELPASTNFPVGDENPYYFLYDNPKAAYALNVSFNMHYATLNKRITHLRFYIATGETMYLPLKDEGIQYVSKRKEGYVLVREVEVANSESAKGIFTLNGLSRLALPSFNITYNMYTGNQGRLQDNTGYLPTTDYLQSWDKAIQSGSEVFYIGGYLGERYTNKVFVSHQSEDAPTPDIATGTKFADAERRDGDDIITGEILQTGHIALLKQNSIQVLDRNTLQISDIMSGTGCVAKNGVINFGDRIVFPSKHGVYTFDGIRLINISDGYFSGTYSEGSTYHSTITAVKDPLQNSFIMNWSGGNKFLFVPGKGWFQFADSNNVKQYRLNNDDNLIYGLTDNGIIKITNTREAGSTLSPYLSWNSVEISNATTEELKDVDRFLITYFWMQYSSPKPISLIIYLDDISTNPITLTFPATTAIISGEAEIGRQVEIHRIPVKAGSTCRKFTHRITLGLTSGDKYFELLSHGVGLEPRKVGIWGR